jgi:WD40 repeat protein
MHGHEQAVRVVLFADASTVVSGSVDTTVRVWNVETGECRFVLDGHSGAITALDVYGTIIVSGGTDMTVRIWDLTTGQCTRVLAIDAEGTFTRFALNESRTRLAVAVFGADRTVDIWSVEDG